MLRNYFVALLLLFSVAGCSTQIRGTFGWTAVDDRGIEDFERGLLLETEFRIKRENLYFFDYQTIWWVYQIRGGRYSGDGFLAALYENNNTPDPVEVDLRRVPILRDGSYDYIRQYYEDLSPGRYLLKIAYESEVVDQVEFFIVPPGGPSEMIRDDEFANFEEMRHEDVEEDFHRDREGSGRDEEFDEILRYSGGL